MCELMGLCVEKPISASFSIQEFRERDEKNVDGWGLAWYPDESAALIKEPVSWRSSPHTVFLEKYQLLLSRIYIAHVRHKTVGGRSTHADTHPFLRELGGREYAFAHNGTLIDLNVDCPLSGFNPIGSTDSEYAFCFLMGQIERRGDHLAGDAAYEWLHNELTSLNRHGQLNCLLSDGRSLICYHDVGAYKGLVWRKIDQPGQQLEPFADSEMQIELESGRSIHGFIVASHPLGGSDWRSFQPGELIVIEQGVLRYSSHSGVPIN